MIYKALAQGSCMLAIAACSAALQAAPAQPRIGSRHIPVIEVDGLRFRDLNRDGVLEPYEDWQLPADTRAADLVSRMTLAEKGGAVMHGNFLEQPDAEGRSTIGYRLGDIRPYLLDKHITGYITRLAVPPAKMAEQNNLVQELAEEGRLGIPVTVSTDPRNHFLYITGQSSDGRGYSQWPETIGFAALGDPALVRTFANIARQEYRATGITQALSPQVDLYTEPRWARGYGGFGSNPALSRAMAKAYVQGFQGSDDGLAGDGVLTTIKHWVAYGATVNGFDAHNAYGKLSRVDERSFKMQLEPFLGGFDAGVGAVMPTYAIVQGVKVNGKPLEPVGGGFSKQLLTDLLRGTYHFKGLILSDWSITNDCTVECSAPTKDAPQGRSTLAMPWGVEKLTRVQRFANAMNAGVDQFGGVAEPDKIVDAVQQGLIRPERLDEAVRQVMVPKFEMGLFEDPFVDIYAVAGEVDPPEVAALSAKVQAQAQVLLKDSKHLLPLAAGTRVYAHGVSDDAIRAAGLVPESDPDQAQVALVRTSTPYQKLHPYNYIGSLQHEGRLDFPQDNPDRQMIESLAAKLPVITAIFLDRPAVLGTVNTASSVILGNFGISDAALMSALTGKVGICGHLPFELPSSMKAVEAQNPALPDDSRDPLYPVGSGLTGDCR